MDRATEHEAAGGAPAHAAMVAPQVRSAGTTAADHAVKLTARDVCVYYGDKKALNEVSMEIPDRAVTAFIGPSGCGKSTFLRCINRMNDTIDNCRVTGDISVEGKNIYARNVDPVALRA